VLFSGNLKQLNEEEALAAFNNLPEYSISEEKKLVELLVEASVCSSKREAREMMASRSISLNGEQIEDLDFIVRKTDCLVSNFLIIRRGKKQYFVIKFL
jgi:tyrosyl-tRNA synthetase